MRSIERKALNAADIELLNAAGIELFKPFKLFYPFPPNSFPHSKNYYLCTPALGRVIYQSTKILQYDV